MRILLFVLVTTAFSCNKKLTELSPGFNYYPSSGLLESGLVWKYYAHGTEKNEQTKTDIVYIKILKSNQTLFVEQYNAGFQKEHSYELNTADHFWTIENQKSFRLMNRDPMVSKETLVRIDENVEIDWHGNQALTDKTTVTNERGFRVIDRQYENIDSISDGKGLKIIKSKRNFIRIFDQQLDTFNYDSKSIYKEGLGLIRRTRHSDQYLRDMILDELMTAEAFQQRTEHGTHRVGYIDTLQTLDDYKLFSPCYSPAKIFDYYNDRRAEFIGGKGRLRKILLEKLDTDLLKGESGYLTFRFVVNCKGEAGWFVTEEADLDYNKKQFREETRTHFYNILKSEKKWTYLTIRNKPRDAYTYLTFKISNGEIIEILP